MTNGEEWLLGDIAIWRFGDCGSSVVRAAQSPNRAIIVTLSAMTVTLSAAKGLFS
jgi:hypothetical protein